MKLFLSWSGDTSKQIAFVLKDWIPLILPNVRPFLSPADIEKGSKWSGEITKELSETNFGLICLTKDNLQSQWLAFEAGALSKSLDSRAATLLLGISHSDVKQPLAMFQGSLFTKDEMLSLIKSMNSSAKVEEQRANDQINTVFEKFWGDVETQINLILQNSNTKTKPVDKVPPKEVQQLQDDRIEELLSLARVQNQLLSSQERILRPLLQEIQSATRRTEDPFYRGGSFFQNTNPQGFEKSLFERIIASSVRSAADDLLEKKITKDKATDKPTQANEKEPDQE